MSINSFCGDYEFLSNFAYCYVCYDGQVYPTVEHAFQAAKTLNVDERMNVQLAKTPGKAKRLGKKVTLRKDWENIKLFVMYELLVQKFGQEPFKEKLLATGNVELVEGNSWGDRFWGICDGIGENHLGKLLMKIREELKEK